VIELAAVAAAFGHRLHDSGVPVTPQQSARFASAVVLAQPKVIDDVYWLGRVTLLTGYDQVQTYDRVFRHIFQGLIDIAEVNGKQSLQTTSMSGAEGPTQQDAPQDSRVSPSGPRGSHASPGERSAGSDDEDAPPQVLAAMSSDERLSNVDFSRCTPDELSLIRRLVEQLPLVPPMRSARRTKRHGRGRSLDVRATLRRAHRTAGDPVELIMRTRTEQPRRVVLIADVSGSMEPYARVYLHLMKGAVQALHAEAFVFATRLTRLTHTLSTQDPDVAYRKATQAAPDWSGGTRIGRTLMEFLDMYGRRGTARGAVVVIVSDGWETDDPAVLREAMARLSRLAHHIIWVNPRKAATDYQPLVAGLQAALPFVDTFVSGHSLRALEEVMAAISNATRRSLTAA
jgi:uncharacterized protein with von Willebrand factor type A (vWA) domain